MQMRLPLGPGPRCRLRAPQCSPFLQGSVCGDGFLEPGLVEVPACRHIGPLRPPVYVISHLRSGRYPLGEVVEGWFVEVEQVNLYGYMNSRQKGRTSTRLAMRPSNLSHSLACSDDFLVTDRAKAVRVSTRSVDGEIVPDLKSMVAPR